MLLLVILNYEPITQITSAVMRVFVLLLVRLDIALLTKLHIYALGVFHYHRVIARALNQNLYVLNWGNISFVVSQLLHKVHTIEIVPISHLLAEVIDNSKQLLEDIHKLITLLLEGGSCGRHSYLLLYSFLFLSPVSLVRKSSGRLGYPLFADDIRLVRTRFNAHRFLPVVKKLTTVGS